MTTVSFPGLDAIGRAIEPANFTGDPIPNSAPPAPPIHRQPMTEAEMLSQSFQDKVFDANVRLGAVTTALSRLDKDTSATAIVQYADILASYVLAGEVPEVTTKPTFNVVTPLHGSGPAREAFPLTPPPAADGSDGQSDERDTAEAPPIKPFSLFEPI